MITMIFFLNEENFVENVTLNDEWKKKLLDLTLCTSLVGEISFLSVKEKSAEFLKGMSVVTVL